MKTRWADGARLRQIRIRRQIQQKKLAALADVTNTTLSSIEAGRYQPGDLLAFRLAEALGCTVEDFSTEKHSDSGPVAAA